MWPLDTLAYNQIMHRMLNPPLRFGFVTGDSRRSEPPASLIHDAMNKLLALLALALLVPPAVSAQGAEDEAAIRDLVTALSEAWTAGDAEAWAAPFADDADFTVWFGLTLSGREEIAQGHGFIFDGIYAETVFDLEVRKVRFLGPDIAIAHLEGRVAAAGEPLPEEPSAVPLAVLSRGERGWEIVAFQNTPFAVEQYGQSGDIRRLKAGAAGEQ